MATNPTIQFKRKITSGTPSSLSIGEPAVNTADNQLFIGTNGPAVKWVGAEIENSSTNGTTWTSDLKLATKKAVGDYFMPLGGGLFSGDITLTGGSDLRFRETGGGTDFVAFQAPAAITTSVTWTLPAADGSANYILTTNGSGTLSWSAPAAASTVSTTSDDTATTRYIVMSGSASSTATLYVDDTTTPLSYNPNTATMTISGDLAVNGGDVTSSATTFNLLNSTVTTMNFGGASTAITMGDSTTATTTIRGGTLVGNTTTQNLFNTTATTLNVGGAATAITMGDSTTATTTIRGGTLVGNTATQAVFNATATTVNAFGAATAITMGDSTTATTTIRGGTLVGNTTTQNLFNTTATTLNVGGAATTVAIGAATGTATINNANTVVAGDLAVNGADITTTATGTATLFNTNATTVNIAGAGTTVSIGAATGTTTINNANTVVTGDLAVNGADITTTATGTATLFNTNATTVNIAGAATTSTIGYNSTAASITNISTGAVAASTIKTVNVGTGGAASSTTNVNIGSANGGTVTINSDAVVSGNLTVSGTTTTVNSSTLSVNDPLIFLANNNGTTDAVDIGFYGLYDTSGTQDLYTGMFRDASDDKYKLFKALQSAPTTTVNTGGTGYAVATLVADLEGKVSGLTVTSSTGTLTIANGKTLTASNTLTFTGTDSSSVAFGTGGTVAYIGSNNAFTGANTFTNATGQTFRPAATQDGIIVQGRAGGTSSYAVTLATATLGASRTFTIPDVDGTAITTGNLSSITAVGTIASGTWNGNAIGVAYGGTNLTSYTVGDVIYASGATTLSKLSASSTAGAVLASTGSASAPEYKTISFTNGSATSGSGTLTLAVQDAAADGSTKGIATFNSSQFDSASGVITLDTIDGGTYA